MLVPRLKAQVDTDVPQVAAILDTLERFTERYNAGTAYDILTTDAHAADQLHDVMLAHLRRANVAGLVQRHRCPHVPGMSEPSWTICRDAQYDYQETVL